MKRSVKHIQNLCLIVIGAVISLSIAQSVTAAVAPTPTQDQVPQISPAPTKNPSSTLSPSTKKAVPSATPAPTFSPTVPKETTETLVSIPDSEYWYINTSTIATSPATRYESEAFSIAANTPYKLSVGLIPYSLLGRVHNGGVRFEIVCWNQSGCTAQDGSSVAVGTQLAVIRLRPGSLASQQLGTYMKKNLSGISFPAENTSVIMRITAGYGTEVGIDEVIFTQDVANRTHFNLIKNGDFTQVEETILTRNYPTHFRENTSSSFEYAARDGKLIMRGRYQPDFTNGNSILNTFYTTTDRIRPEQLQDQFIRYKGRVTKVRETGNQFAKIRVKNIETGHTAHQFYLNTNGEEQEFALRLALIFPGRYQVLLSASNGTEVEVDELGIVGAGYITENLLLNNTVSIDTSIRRPRFWTSGENNVNDNYSEVVKKGWSSPGSPPDTTPQD